MGTNYFFLTGFFVLQHHDEFGDRNRHAWWDDETWPQATYCLVHTMVARKEIQMAGKSDIVIVLLYYLLLIYRMQIHI